MLDYREMCCEVEPEIKAACEEVPTRIRLEETEKTLIETQVILQEIIVSIINAPKPSDEMPKATCMNEQLLINYNLSTDCRGMAKRIHDLLFGSR